MPTITLDIPDEAFAALRRTPEQFARDLRLAAAMFWYAKGDVSQERAAQIAGLSRADFLMALSREAVEVFQVDAKEFDAGASRGGGEVRKGT